MPSESLHSSEFYAVCHLLLQRLELLSSFYKYKHRGSRDWATCPGCTGKEWWSLALNTGLSGDKASKSPESVSEKGHTNAAGRSPLKAEVEATAGDIRQTHRARQGVARD